MFTALATVGPRELQLAQEAAAGPGQPQGQLLHCSRVDSSQPLTDTGSGYRGFSDPGWKQESSLRVQILKRPDQALGREAGSKGLRFH